MTEKPILFNGEMVRAILDGRKFQTRRPVKNQPNDKKEIKAELSYDELILTYRAFPDGGSTRWGIEKSPFGKPGDVLWVRETVKCTSIDESGRCYCHYVADRNPCCKIDTWVWQRFVLPSIHMPYGACRIKLNVKRVWVERVQNITRSDIRAEGVTIPPHQTNEESYKAAYVKAWSGLWDSIYGNWDNNPRVWCCEFEVSK